MLIGGRTLYVNTAAAEIPRTLGGIVSAVLGLNSVGAMKSTLALPSAPQYLVSYTPKQFQPLGAGVNGVPAGAPLVNYPAASPYVIAVGGTTLLTTSAGAYDL